MEFDARDVNSARETILKCIRRNRDKKVIYFNGWSSFGEAPVLRSIAQELRTIKDKKTPLELCFDIIIYIDCSAWKNRREMQKKIAEELELDIETMAMFDKQDEEDDFNGVDQDSRDVLRSVSTAIDQKLGHRKFIMIFLNGGKDEVDVSRFGINPEYRDHTIIWTFNRLYLTIREDHLEIKRKLRYTDIFVLVNRTANGLTSSEFCAVLREVAANIVARHPCMQNINLTMVMECCLYELFVQYSFHRATSFAWAAHAPNYWMCDGIIKENGKKEICRSTLHQEIHWECDASRLDFVFEMLMKDPEAPFFIVKDDISFLKRRPCRWICVTSKDLVRIHVDIKTRFKMASSLFVALEESAKPPCLPNGFLKHCSNLCVLALSHCAFSFVSPPFLRCHKLRFLGLDHCSHDNTSEAEDNANWKCLQNLWVLDLRYTEWDDILSKEKMNIMANLREVNIEGYMCWQLIARFHRRLSHLQRLRIIKPTHKAKTSTESSSSFIDKTELEILDLSGNRDMEKLSISSSVARSLLVLILDGCDGLDDVVVPDGLPSSLRLFSFDGYGPAAHWMSSFELPLQSAERERPPDADKRVVKTSKISLQGCTQLENLFVRGLPNLVELDLSGSAIKVLDFTTMVVDVPGLKRLFLLGCEHLSAIKWGSYDSMKQLKLELLCIDTRHRRVPGFTRSSLAQHKSFSLQLHATLADARLTRPLYELINHYRYRFYYKYKGIYFNIQITSSIEYGGEMIQIQPSNQQHHVLVRGYGGEMIQIQPSNQQHHGLMEWHVESLHMHDASTSASMSTGSLKCLKWSRVESCPRIETVFPSGPTNYANMLETIWASDLQMARCIWSKGAQSIPSFEKLQHLYLRSCPRLQFVLPVWFASFPSLETLHINHCGDLTHVFVLDGRYPQKIVTYGVPFPKLTTIHFHDLPKLQRIMCEVKMLAPALETIMIRGCFALRQLPSLQGRRRGAKRPTVEMEKDVWDALEWNGLAAGHHPDLFEPPVHSRYYRRRRLLRGTVLR
ncbi:unnamed protein product [Urochloa decumbens]|uniref:Disease resistance protein At4g27190-like leucine-rich repeats domain-containing protein n=1 Tax=Urochloa decumbens TaxID=240449 RepID=A0ABC8VCY7_9POAL